MFTIVPDFNLKEWERSLEEVLLIDFDKFVLFLYIFVYLQRCKESSPKCHSPLLQGGLLPQRGQREQAGRLQAGRGG